MADPPIAQSKTFRGPNWVFDMLGTSFFWLGKSRELHRATTIIAWQIVADVDELRAYAEAVAANPGKVLPRDPMPPSLWGIWALLAGLTLENLLKGMYVREHPESIKQGKLQPGLIKSHDLVALAGALAVALDGDERDLLATGSRAIVGWGRYPLPTDLSKLEGEQSIHIRALDVFESLFQRLATDLDARPFSDGSTRTEET
jgi:hypothetical protein